MHTSRQAQPLPAAPPATLGPQRNEPGFDLRGELYRTLDVDLTQVPGLQTISVSTFLSEVGPTVERFPTPKHFASWLGLCPDNRITGGKVLCAATRAEDEGQPLRHAAGRGHLAAAGKHLPPSAG